MTLLEVVEKWGKTAKIPLSEIFQKSADGKTVVLLDGTKVSDELIADAQKAADAVKAAAAAAATAGKELLDHPEFVQKVSAIATEAAQAVINAAKGGKKPEAQD